MSPTIVSRPAVDESCMICDICEQRQVASWHVGTATTGYSFRLVIHIGLMNDGLKTTEVVLAWCGTSLSTSFCPRRSGMRLTELKDKALLNSTGHACHHGWLGSSSAASAGQVQCLHESDLMGTCSASSTHRLTRGFET